MESEQTGELDLRHLVAVLRQRAWLIAVLVAVAVGTTLLVTARMTPLYQATSQVHVFNPNSENIFSAANVAVDPKREVDTQIQFVKAPEVADDAESKLGDRAAQIRSVDVSGLETTDIIQIKVTSPSPEVARDAANTYAEVYVTHRRQQVSAVLDQRAQELRGKAADLDTQIAGIESRLGSASPGEAANLRAQQASMQKQQQEFQQRASELEVEGAVRTGNVELASKAQLPEAPVSPAPKKDAGLSAVLALLAGVGLVLLLDRLDDRIASPEDAEAAADMPVLGTVPIYAPDKKRSPHHLPHGERTLVPLTSVNAEAFRTLRTSLRFSALGKSKQTIMITSSSGNEGKSTVTANLAVALAESGLKVVVISADLRRPTVAKMFGLDESKAGLTTALLGEAQVTDCMATVKLASGQKLWVLPSGPLPPNPAELLGSPAMRAMLEQIGSAGVDFILLDCPPVLPVADALAMAQHVDGVILLAVPGQTRAHNMAEASDRLRKVGASTIGVVLNGVPLSGGRYSYYYYYRQYGGYEAKGSNGNGNGGKPSPKERASTA